jgi:hypothetical protein
MTQQEQPTQQEDEQKRQQTGTDGRARADERDGRGRAENPQGETGKEDQDAQEEGQNVEVERTAWNPDDEEDDRPGRHVPPVE